MRGDGLGFRDVGEVSCRARNGGDAAGINDGGWSGRQCVSGMVC